MKQALKTKARSPIDCCFGTDPEGNTLAIELSEGPHWICAGQTGSGKSVFINSMLISMMSHATPDELKIAWVDPKKVEASAYIGSPYCPIAPITDMGDAYGLTAYFCWLMDDRYSKLEKLKVKNLTEYNDWVEKHPQEAKRRKMEKMCYWVLVVDEYADMKIVEGASEQNLIRIGQKARAAGIHMIVATQRPSADILTPLLKANCPGRIGLKVADSINSQIILDDVGAEKLAGYGDGILKTQSGETFRVQGPYISNEEIDRIFSYLKKRYPKPEFIDYKQIAVDADLCEWAPPQTAGAEDGGGMRMTRGSTTTSPKDPSSVYPEGTKWEDMHVRKKKRQLGAAF